MISRLMLAAAPLVAAFPASSPAQPAPSVTVESMRRHIEILASDAYEGRKPGTAGENKTVAYIAAQLQAAGLRPAANGSWYQPVPLVHRAPFAQRALVTAGGKTSALAPDEIILIGKDPVESVADAPIWFIGEGTPEAIAGADLAGAVVLVQPGAPQGRGSGRAFIESLREAGVAAVISIVGDETPWSAVTDGFGRGQDRLQSLGTPEISGAVPAAMADRLIGGELLARAGEPGFRATRLPARATLDVSTAVRPYTSHNVVGRLQGSGSSGESVMYLGHWDHLGICRPDDSVDKICNGAVDNASGIAMLIEIARHIGRGDRPERDLLFLATTAEEMGLLGAEYFAAAPTAPLDSIVAAINIDTVAIHDAGEPVAIVGRGTTPLDPIVDATARELGRGVDTDDEANAFVQRQDGWALTRAGVPTVMVGGSFANMESLGAFLSGPYHEPEDDLDRPLKLEGAAEDAELLIALGRKLADPDIYQPAGR